VLKAPKRTSLMFIMYLGLSCIFFILKSSIFEFAFVEKKHFFWGNCWKFEAFEEQ